MNRPIDASDGDKLSEVVDTLGDIGVDVEQIQNVEQVSTGTAADLRIRWWDT